MTEQPNDGFSGDPCRGSNPFAHVPYNSSRFACWTPEGDQDSADGSSFGAGLTGASKSESQAEEAAPKKPARKRRAARKPKDSSEDGSDDGAPAPDADDAPRAKKKRRSRARKPRADADDGPADDIQASDERPGDDRGDESDDSDAARKRRRRGSRGGRRRKRGDEEDGAAAIDAIPGEDDDFESKRTAKGSKKAAKKKSSRRKSSSRRDAEDDAESNVGDDDAQVDSEAGTDQDDGEAGGRKKRRRRRSRKGSASRDDEDEDGAPRASDDDEEDSGKGRKRSRSRSKKKDKDGPKAKSKARAASKTAEEKEREANALRTQTIAVNAVEPEERRVAVYEGEIILDFLMNAESQKTLVNDIYRGRVVNLEPAIGAAFIDFGQGRNGFLHTSDVLPLYGSDDFELNDLLTAGLHHEDGDHDADWAEEADEFDDDEGHDGDDESDAVENTDDADRYAVVAEIAEIDDLDDEPAGKAFGDGAADDLDALDEEDDEDLEEEEEEEEGGARDSDDAPKRPQRKRRPRRSAKSSDDGDDAPPDDGEKPKPARKRTRKKASTRTASRDEDGDGPAGDVAAGDAGDGEARERRPRKKRTRKAASSRKDKDSDDAVDGGGDAEDAPKKKRSRSKKASKSKAKSSKKAARSGRSSKRAGSGRSSSGGSSRSSARGRGRGRQERRPQRERRPINELLKVGDPVVVQITKDAIGDKGPTLTTYISMPGRYLVLMPSMARTGVSRKIPDEKERKRLKRILTSMNTPPDMGVIVRTAGVGRTKTDLQRDLDYLMGLWESFGKKLKGSRGPAPLYLESDVATRTLRDLFNRETKEVLVDDVGVYEQMVSFANALMPEHVDRIKKYEGERPLFQDCGIEQDFERIFSRRVDLPSGGSIVFDQAEALVAIDVNSGRTRTNSYDFEEIALKTNLEAVPEIARQIKLRDLGGIIVCDFIDMVRSNSNRSVEKLLRSELASDRARSKLGRISQFGLLELTRQRLGPGTHKKVFMACPRCRGTGRIRSIESRAQAILRRLGGALTQKGFSKVEVRAHPEVIAYLKEDLWDWVRAMEHRTEKEILLTGVPDQAEDSVLRYLRTDGREVRPGGRRKR